MDGITRKIGHVVLSTFLTLPGTDDKNAEKTILKMAKKHDIDFIMASDLDGCSLLHMAVKSGIG
jgi:hypothetical protein